MKKELKDDFLSLGFDLEQIPSATVKESMVAFRKLAKQHHPDKAGVNSTAAFQTLLNSYRNVLEYLIDKVKDDPQAAASDHNDDDDKGASFTKDNFSNFMFPKENEGSFTVLVQDEKANQWEVALENKYGKPTLEVNGVKGKTYGKNWKINYTADEKTVELTVHFYNKPQKPKKSKFSSRVERNVINLFFTFMSSKNSP